MHIHLDAIGGVAGDMFVAAMLDALPDLADRVLADIASVLPDEAGQPELVEVRCNGLAAKHFRLAGGNAGSTHATGYAGLLARIGIAQLSAGTSRAAAAILGVLAEAESAIHGVPLPEVHFHEIGDWDSLADVVAAGSIIATLAPASWSVSSLPLGGGRVSTAHGQLPVPAPAAAALLKGFNWVDDGVPGERVTPTGAAILKYLVTPDSVRPPGTLRASGSGAGTRRMPGLPNLLRALVFELEPQPDRDTVVVISFEVDDMTGEEIGTAANRLRTNAGVLDLSLAQRRGKKDRPMEEFRLLVRPERAEAVARECFLQTSTIGLRIDEQRRLLLSREHSEGPVRTKRAFRPDGAETVKAENDDLAADTLAARRAARRNAEIDD